MIVSTALLLLAATVPLKPCPFPMRTDRERDGLVGPVRTARCIPAAGLATDPGCRPGLREYDRWGWLQKEGELDLSGAPIWSSDYRRDARTGHLQVIQLGPGGIPTGVATTATCDDSKRMMTLHKFDRFGTIERIILTYDEVGELHSQEVLYADGALNVKETYEYDALGRRTQTTFKWGRAGDPGRMSVKYDAHGNVEEEDWFSVDGKLYARELFTEELDAHGNWVKRVITPCSPSSGSQHQPPCADSGTEERVITYYPSR